MFKKYYNLTKPGIIYGNLLTATGGFLLASRGLINFWLLLETLIGISLIIASACVLNNYIDRDIDKHMARTKDRALVTGAVSAKTAIVYAGILGFVGFMSLVIYTNTITLVLGLTAYTVYITLYGYYKRRSVYGTLVGSIAGALPPVAGYTAVTSALDFGALIIFLVLVLWQMPHFYSIALFRFNDYKTAGLPVLPVKKGKNKTKIQILCYILLFIIVTPSLTIFSYAGYSYAVVMITLGIIWLYKAIAGLKVTNTTKWARQMFGFSLIVIMGFSITLMLNSILP